MWINTFPAIFYINYSSFSCNQELGLFKPMIAMKGV